MPVNVSQDFKDHDKHTVVGVVQEAWVDGSRLMVSGLLYDKNEQSLVARIQANKHQLGMSYEVSSCVVADTAASVWTLTDFEFTGCAILDRSYAAYQSTAIAARAGARGR